MSDLLTHKEQIKKQTVKVRLANLASVNKSDIGNIYVFWAVSTPKTVHSSSQVIQVNFLTNIFTYLYLIARIWHTAMPHQNMRLLFQRAARMLTTSKGITDSRHAPLFFSITSYLSDISDRQQLVRRTKKINTRFVGAWLFY